LTHFDHTSPAETPERVVRTVRQLNEEISDAVSRAFPGTVWVRGEVQRLPMDAARRKHVYFELHEAGSTGAAAFQIPAQLLDWDRRRFNLGRYLDGTDPDLQLANKMEVCLECRVDFYAPFGKLGLKVVGVDPAFSLGQLEARRRQTLAWLKEHDLLELNQSVPLPDLPLTVGLITSPDSAAHHDFMEGIGASPWAFDIRLRGAKMQGERVQAEVVQAMAAHIRDGVDVIVITRGGGSRADLSWFDQQDLAEAIARCPLPVITAIGHEIDRSIADVVAHQSCKTPTAAADFLTDHVAAAAERLDSATNRLLEISTDLMDTARARLQVEERLIRSAHTTLLRQGFRIQKQGGRLQQNVTGRLRRSSEDLARLSMNLSAVSRGRLSTAEARLAEHGRKLASAGLGSVRRAKQKQTRWPLRLTREATRGLEKRAARLENLATQTRLLDPARLLARGYTLTRDSAGQAVRSAADLAPGDGIFTHFVDGQVKSIVQPGGGTSSRTRKTEKRKDDGEEKDTPQKTLFR